MKSVIELKKPKHLLIAEASMDNFKKYLSGELDAIPGLSEISLNEIKNIRLKLSELVASYLKETNNKKDNNKDNNTDLRCKSTDILNKISLLGLKIEELDRKNASDLMNGIDRIANMLKTFAEEGLLTLPMINVISNFINAIVNGVEKFFPSKEVQAPLFTMSEVAPSLAPVDEMQNVKVMTAVKDAPLAAKVKNSTAKIEMNNFHNVDAITAVKDAPSEAIFAVRKSSPMAKVSKAPAFKANIKVQEIGDYITAALIHLNERDREEKVYEQIAKDEAFAKSIEIADLKQNRANAEADMDSAKRSYLKSNLKASSTNDCFVLPPVKSNTTLSSVAGNNLYHTTAQEINDRNYAFKLASEENKQFENAVILKQKQITSDNMLAILIDSEEDHKRQKENAETYAQDIEFVNKLVAKESLFNNAKDWTTKVSIERQIEVSIYSGVAA